MLNVNDKYRDILTYGKELFWKYGIKKVTVEEICREAGTSRVTFYKYFQNKDQLAYQVLKNVLEDSMDRFRKILGSGEDFETRVEEMIHFKIESTNHLSFDFLKDAYGGDYPEIIKLLEVTRKESMELIEGHFRDAQSNGEIRSDLDMKFLIYFINMLQELATDSQLEKMYSDSGELISELIQFLFYGIIPRKSNK